MKQIKYKPLPYFILKSMSMKYALKAIESLYGCKVTSIHEVNFKSKTGTKVFASAEKDGVVIHANARVFDQAMIVRSEKLPTHLISNYKSFSRQANPR